MKADEKGLDAAMQATLLRKAEKDYAKSLQIIDLSFPLETLLIKAHLLSLAIVNLLLGESNLVTNLIIKHAH